jgi:hypothetical protein
MVEMVDQRRPRTTLAWSDTKQISMPAIAAHDNLEPREPPGPDTCCGAPGRLDPYAMPAFHFVPPAACPHDDRKGAMCPKGCKRCERERRHLHLKQTCFWQQPQGIDDKTSQLTTCVAAFLRGHQRSDVSKQAECTTQGRTAPQRALRRMLLFNSDPLLTQ